MLELLPFDHQLQRKNRKDLSSLLNRRAGKGNWFWTFRAGKQLYSFDWGLQLYEDAYWVHFRENIDLVKDIVSHYNVYVWDRYDLESELDYTKQTKEREHYADIAIRRTVVRLGLRFKGKDLFKIPNSDLSDTKVPFHLPHLIVGQNKSARSWLNNRIIAIAPDVEGKCELSNLIVK
jgi:hypothetical protein